MRKIKALASRVRESSSLNTSKQKNAPLEAVPATVDKTNDATTQAVISITAAEDADDGPSKTASVLVPNNAITSDESKKPDKPKETNESKATDERIASWEPRSTSELIKANESKEAGELRFANKSTQADEPTEAYKSLEENKDTWTAAYEALKARNSPLIESLEKNATAATESSTLSLDRPEDVKKLIDYAQKTHDENQLIVSLGSRSININKCLTNMFNFITWSKSIIDIAVAPQPYASLAWSCVSVFLPIMSEAVGQTEQMASLFGKVTLLLDKYQLREAVFLRKNSYVSTPAYRNAIVVLYTELLDFQLTVVSHLLKSSAQRTLDNIFGSDGWASRDTKLDQLDKHCDTFMAPIEQEEKRERFELKQQQTAELLEYLRQVSADTGQMSVNLGRLVALNKQLLLEIQKWRRPALDDSHETNLKLREQAWREAFLEVLNYETRCFKELQVERFLDIDDTSFQWVWKSKYRKWLQKQDPLFWISGKPASGKSTLMNYLIKSSQTLAELETNSKYGSWDIISFFFDYRFDRDLANSTEGLLRSVLLQLLQKYPRVTKEVAKTFRTPSDLLEMVANDRDRIYAIYANRAKQSFRENASNSQLRKAIMTCLSSLQKSICIFFDGLDEFTGDSTELIGLIKDLSNSSRLSTSYSLKICVASRPGDPYPESFAGKPTFKMEDLNEPGIRGYITKKFEDQLSHKQRQSKEKLRILIEKVVERAQGVFLWVRFAVKEMVTAIRTKKKEFIGSEELKERLRVFPDDLQEVYARIVRDVLEPSSRVLATILLILIRSAVGDLQLDQLQQALSFGPGCFDEPLNSILEKFVSHSSSISQIVSPGFIVAETGGLLEVFNAGSKRQPRYIVRTLHETVDTYLDFKGGWQKLAGEDFVVPSGNQIWLKIYSNVWIDFDRCHGTKLLRDLNSRALGATMISRFMMEIQTYDSLRLGPNDALLRHVLRQAGYHAKALETATATPSSHLLQPMMTAKYWNYHFSLPEPIYCRCHRALDIARSEKYFAIVLEDAIGYCLLHDIHLSVKDYLERTIRLANRLENDQGPTRFRETVRVSIGTDDELPEERRRFSALQNLYILSFNGLFNINTEQLDILSLFLKVPQCLEMSTLMSSISWGQIDVVKCLLRAKSGESLTYHFGEADAPPHLPTSYTFLHRGNQYGALWFFAVRLILEGRLKSTSEEILSLLLDAGEHLNEPCGPDGNVLCSYVRMLQHHTGEGYRESLPFIKLLKHFGLKINHPGPLGTALDIAWKFANECVDIRQRRKGVLSSTVYPLLLPGERLQWNATCLAMDCLIKVGARPTRVDPNGSVRRISDVLQFVEYRDYAPFIRDCARFYNGDDRDRLKTFPRVEDYGYD